jgi:CheY-like chemotaxis protein
MMEQFNLSFENIAAESTGRKFGRILLAEDDEVNQKIAQLILQKTGFQIDVAANGQQAVAAYKQNRYDLILMDIQMPVMDGHEATKRIRIWEGGMRNKIEKDSDSTSDFQLPTSDFKRVPIIAMTGDASMNRFDPQRYPGMDDWVCKPLQRDQLLSVIATWTGLGSSEASGQRPINAVADHIEKSHEKNLPIDLDRAIDEFMGKKKILFAVLDQFMSRTVDQISGLRRALCRSDYRVIAAEGHRLKGAAANLRADRLSRAASHLEKAAENEKKEEICELIENLAEEFHHLENFLRQF